MADVDATTVAQVAALAKLHLEPEECEGLARDLSQILDYVARLDELDLSDEAPTAHPFREAMPLRADEVRPGPAAEDLLALAPDRHESHFRVPQIIGGDDQ